MGGAAEAETDLQHGTGAPDAGGLAANTADHEAAHLVFGPYAQDWEGTAGTATFRMMVDDVDFDDLVMVTLDVFDAISGTIVGSRAVTRTEFDTPWQYSDFDVPFTMPAGPASMEVRAFWHDMSYLRIDRVTVITK